ncbi:Hypothetical protein NTJ_01509 [Nesidiocoris tenuis]|uniref:Uncharacterized protein n=1 Tax=Nesidiocoris tenuis TaxID=355587 RepID=A0ABN7A8S2_9HEMI|nr:Hypothetical protein NTJ_01509 [Nesidiocoris tenuis]
MLSRQRAPSSFASYKGWRKPPGRVSIRGAATRSNLKHIKGDGGLTMNMYEEGCPTLRNRTSVSCLSLSPYPSGQPPQSYSASHLLKSLSQFGCRGTETCHRTQTGIGRL